MKSRVKITVRSTALSGARTRQVLKALQQIVNEADYHDDLGDRDIYELSLSTYNYPHLPEPGSSLLVGATYRLYAESPEALVARFREYVGEGNSREA